MSLHFYKIIIEERKRWRTALKGRRNEEKRKNETARSKSKGQIKIKYVTCIIICQRSASSVYCILNMDRTAHKGKITLQKIMWYSMVGITE